MYQAGLVLEGGGMKGFYTTGVLDFFLDKGIEFANVYGVSAGACHMTSYMSKQRGRSYKVCSEYLDTKRYCGVYSLLTTGDLFHPTIAYDLVPKYLAPFDYEEYKRYPGKAYAVCTDVRTGKPVYFPIIDVAKDMEKIRASASLPLVSRNVPIDGGLYLDGGISDAIPVRKSFRDGNPKTVVIMTKEVGYVRKPVSASTMAMTRARYLLYPKMVEAMEHRKEMYDSTLRFMEEQEKAGKVFVIRPTVKSDVARIEKDVTKLRALYEQGYREAEAQYDALMKFLNE
jgi:predicted patatin/cPLA2 family phospholipase